MTISRVEFSLFPFPPKKKDLSGFSPVSSLVFPNDFPSFQRVSPSGSGQQVAIKDQELDGQGAQPKVRSGPGMVRMVDGSHFFPEIFPGSPEIFH